MDTALTLENPLSDPETIKKLAVVAAIGGVVLSIVGYTLVKNAVATCDQRDAARIAAGQGSDICDAAVTRLPIFFLGLALLGAGVGSFVAGPVSGGVVGALALPAAVFLIGVANGGKSL